MATLYATHNVNIPGTSLGGPAAYTITGLQATDVLVITKPSVAAGVGMTYDAASPWSSDANPIAGGLPWYNTFRVLDGSNVEFYRYSSTRGATVAAALANIQAQVPIVLTGKTTYKFAGTDFSGSTDTAFDNRGGISLKVDIYREASIPAGTNHPVITLVSPAEGSVVAVNDTIVIDVTDVDNDVTTFIPFFNGELAFFEGTFTGPYSASSRAPITNAFGVGYRYSFRRSWVGEGLKFTGAVVDATGLADEATFEWDLAVSAPAADAVDLVTAAGTSDPGRDILLDEVSGDFALTADGDLALVGGVPSIVQDIRQTLRMYLGEWFLDEEQGVPWFQSILGVKNPSIAAIRELIRDQLLAVDGVLDVVTLNVALDTITRRLSISFNVSTDLGELVETLEVGV